MLGEERVERGDPKGMHSVSVADAVTSSESRVEREAQALPLWCQTENQITEHWGTWDIALGKQEEISEISIWE